MCVWVLEKKTTGVHIIDKHQTYKHNLVVRRPIGSVPECLGMLLTACLHRELRGSNIPSGRLARGTAVP